MLAGMAIRDWPSDERPREKLLDKGAAALSDAELLAILLRTGTPGHSALDLARAVLKSFHSLRKLIAADRQRFCAERGLGLARFAELQAAVEIARRQLSETLRAGPSLASPRATRDFLSSQLRDLEHEVFCCLYLDKRHRLIQFQELFRGTIDGASVHPREIVKLALQRNAAAVIIAHSVARHRMRIMCPRSFCGRYLVSAYGGSQFSLKRPHNNALCPCLCSDHEIEWMVVFERNRRLPS